VVQLLSGNEEVNYMKNTMRNTIATLACAAALAGCTTPMQEPQRDAYQTHYLRTHGGVSVIDSCDAGGQFNADGIADIVRIGGDASIAIYEFGNPNCKDRRNAVNYLPLTAEMQRAASELLHANDELKYLMDQAIWQRGQRNQ